MKMFAIGLLALALGVAQPAQAADAVVAGQRAPEISAQGSNGQPLKLAALRGQVVLLDFWASWCGPCKQSFPWMNAMHARYAPQGLRIVAVNVDKRREAAERFLAQSPARFTLGWDEDGRTPEAFGVRTMPSSVLIDGDGRVLHVHAGFREEDAADLEQRITAALAGGRK